MIYLTLYLYGMGAIATYAYLMAIEPDGSKNGIRIMSVVWPLAWPVVLGASIYDCFNQ